MISKKAIEMIIKHEVGGRAVYEKRYQKLLELHETDPTLLDKLQDHYRIGQEWKERFYKDTNKIWK